MPFMERLVKGGGRRCNIIPNFLPALKEANDLVKQIKQLDMQGKQPYRKKYHKRT